MLGIQAGSKDIPREILIEVGRRSNDPADGPADGPTDNAADDPAVNTAEGQQKSLEKTKIKSAFEIEIEGITITSKSLKTGEILPFLHLPFLLNFILNLLSI